MTLDRQSKEALVERYSEGFASSANAFVLGYKGISVPEATELRAKVREAGGGYEVVKNSIALRALEGSDMAQLAEHFAGPTAVAFSEGDVVALAKVLTDFSKEVPAVEFRAGLLEGAPVEANQIKEIANLPSREELVAKLLFLLQSPIVRFVRDMGAIIPQFVRVVDQVRIQKAQSE